MSRATLKQRGVKTDPDAKWSPRSLPAGAWIALLAALGLAAWAGSIAVAMSGGSSSADVGSSQLLALAAIAAASLILLAGLLVILYRDRSRSALLTSELERTAKEARRAKVKAQRAGETKSRFLATMSHELRTPLNGVLGSANLLRTSELDDEQQEHVRTIEDCGDVLLGLIQNILEYSALSERHITLDRRPFELKTYLDQAVEHSFSDARRKGVTPTLNVDPTIPERVTGDPIRVRQLISTLLDNAVKFTEEGEITVTVGRIEGDVLRFEIRDTGVGFPQDLRDELFRPFAQRENGSTRTSGGAGLGLAICKRIVEAADGRIGVESNPGVGSTFWFELPLPPATR